VADFIKLVDYGTEAFWGIQKKTKAFCELLPKEIEMVETLYQYLKTPQWRRQHKWRRAIWRAVSPVELSGVYALPPHRVLLIEQPGQAAYILARPFSSCHRC